MGADGWGWLAAALVAAGALLLYIKSRNREREWRRSVRYMAHKLEALAPRLNESEERIMLVTAEPELRELLQAINALIDHGRHAASDYAAAERSMRQMLANMSHDLRTPLTVILGYAEILTGEHKLDSVEQSRLLERMRQKSQDVLKLMNRLFELARLESDDIELPVERLDAGEICRRSLLSYYELLSVRGFEVEVSLPEEPVPVYAHREALERLLDNLLSNAVKYGGEGRYVGLFLSLENREAVIQVCDRGPGIPDKAIHHIFERLYRLDEARSGLEPGSGLGLTIAAKLAERLGGTITAESAPWQLTRFTVRLRAAGKAAAPASQEQTNMAKR